MRLRTIGIVAATVLLLAPAFATMFSKATVKAADYRCSDRMPEDTWGYSFEWDWTEFGFVCTYTGRDYRPTGQRTRVGLADLRGT